MRPDPTLAATLASVLAVAACTSLRAAPADAGGAERDAGPAADAGPRPDGALDVGPAPRDAGAADAGPCITTGEESCNLADDDCDGVVDEDFQITTSEVSFAALASFEPGCAPSAGDVLSCMRAARSWCLARGCATSGFGALRDAADTRVGCFGPRVTELVVSYGDLSLEAIVFDEAAAKNRRGQVAVHRYCRARGFGAGIGPTTANDVTRNATLVCVRDDWSAVVVLPVANSLAAGCDPFTNPDTVRCSAVADEHCTSLGWEAGLGPVEWDASGVHLACVGEL